MNDYIDGKKSIKKIQISLFNAITVAALSVLAVYLFVQQDSSSIRIYGDYSIALSFIPFLLIAGMYGYLVSMMSFLAVFLYVMFTSMEGAFYLSIYLAAVLVYSLFAQYFWFKSIRKTLLIVLCTTLVSGIMGMLCFVAIANNTYELSVFSGSQIYFFGAFGAIFIVSVFLFAFYKYAPDRFKAIFPIGYGYTKEYQENGTLRAYHKKTKISKKITAIIVAVELALGISVAWFTAALFPDLKDMMIENHQVAMQFDEQGRPSEKPDEEMEFSENVERMEYRVNRYAVSFDIKMLLLIMCVGVPLASIANFYTKTRIGAPIGNISSFLDEFVHIGDEHKLAKIRSIENYSFKNNDEIGVLDENLRETLREVVAFIERKDEQRRLESELEVARQASEAKSSFLSNMSHEIRTPINAVLGMNEMILRECEDEQILEYANNAKSAGNTLLGLVNDILDFSKIEAGKMDIITAQYHLGSTINDLVNMVSQKASDKGLAFEVNVDEHIPCILIGDELRIKQCLTNLLSNAVKYTDKGTVTLNAGYEEIDDDNIYLKFEVKDTGSGIKEEDLSKLFSPFERIEEVKNRSIEGTGLGMSIVKNLLALMDSRLEVSSVYGEGSDFSFKVKQQVVSREEIGDFKEKYREYLRSQGKYRQRFLAPDACILVVDDTDMNLTVIRSLLKKTQIQIDTAESGFETLDKVKLKRYDVIFLDHRMPEMDGIETLEAMKDLEGNLNEGVPVISLTANAVSGAKAEYQAHGFTDYLAKPVNGMELERMLEEYLPPDKVLSVPDDEDSEDTEGSGMSDSIPEDSFVGKLRDIDLREAIENCGGVEVLEKVAKDFLISIDSKADAIENSLKEQNIRNYTVYVHALKSSARLIGATELSKMAAGLEEKGNEEDLDTIKAKTPELLEKYRGYKESLSAALDSKEELPDIPIEQLEEAYSGVRELVEAYDFKSAESIMKMLEGYKIPNDAQPKYNELVRLMAALDREEILKFL
ncbi:MAG: response regulator [Lachnospiraceae bacterium]|nr:response regulator [Lachnospiraceae bacterium]